MNKIDDTIVVYDENGFEKTMRILFTYENKERESEYVFLYTEEAPDDIYCMKYNENHELFEVEDEEELAEASEVLETFQEDPQIKEILD